MPNLFMRKYLSCYIRKIILWAGACIFLTPTASFAAHAIAQYGTPKYPENFHHFSYANPDAPQGGTLTLANPNRLTSFDKFNPFTLKGESAPGITALMFESLMVESADEIATAYGLLAEDIALAPDGLSVTFRLRGNARFSNGAPVLANDVKYSFDTLIGPLASPVFRSVCADVKQAVVVAPNIVRFDFSRRNAELPLIIGTLPIFSHDWGKRDDGTRIAFDRLAFDTPIGSGPYLIETYQAGRSITFTRNPRYWGKDLNVRRGIFNFERVRYQLYADDTIRLEAFKAGEFDAIVEYRAKNWAKGFNSAAFHNGKLRKETFTHRNVAGMQGFILNQRRVLFQDPRVRQALGLALDFEWLNRQLFYSEYRRLDSYFTNSELAANAAPNTLPDADEKQLLSELNAQFPGQIKSAVWGKTPLSPATSPPSSLRENLRTARALLAQAGWMYRDGALRNPKGEPFVFEILEDGGAMTRVIGAYTRNLEKLGIKVIQRTSDFALYQKRLEDFDFDVISMVIPGTQSPGNELFSLLGSHAAKESGSNNMIGVQSPVVDALITKIVHAKTRPALITATRVLDRVLLHDYYVVPHWFSDHHRIAYQSKLAYPKTLPLYYGAEGWILSTWWVTPSLPKKHTK